MMNYLKKKINKMKYALVTGGSRGIGPCCQLQTGGNGLLYTD